MNQEKLNKAKTESREILNAAVDMVREELKLDEGVSNKYIISRHSALIGAFMITIEGEIGRQG